jgi:hypothetical protein
VLSVLLSQHTCVRGRCSKLQATSAPLPLVSTIMVPPKHRSALSILRRVNTTYTIASAATHAKERSTHAAVSWHIRSRWQTSHRCLDGLVHVVSAVSSPDLVLVTLRTVKQPLKPILMCINVTFTGSNSIVPAAAG